MSEVQFEGLKVPVKEQVRADIPMADLQDTQNAFYDVNCKMWDIVKDMTLEERQSMNDMMAGHKESLRKTKK